MQLRGLTVVFVVGLFVTALFLFSTTAKIAEAKKSTVQTLLAQAQSAPSGTDECAVKRSRKPGATTDFTKVHLKGSDTKVSARDAKELSKTPPGGMCNKACRFCQNPKTGGIWCDICEACYYNVE